MQALRSFDYGDTSLPNQRTKRLSPNGEIPSLAPLWDSALEELDVATSNIDVQESKSDFHYYDTDKGRESQESNTVSGGQHSDRDEGDEGDEDDVDDVDEDILDRTDGSDSQGSSISQPFDDSEERAIIPAEEEKPHIWSAHLADVQSFEPAEGSKAVGELGLKFFNVNTISDDQSAGSRVQERNLHVFKDSSIEEKAKSHALASYQVELMLLTQKNKKRLQAARSTVNMEIEASNSNEIVSKTDNMDYVDISIAKTEVQNVFDGADTSLDLQKLQEHIELLHAKVQQFETITEKQISPRFQVLYRIWHLENENSRSTKLKDSLPFFDHPQWIEGQGSERQLRCKLPLNNFDLYIEKNKDIAFIVYRNFDTRLKDNMATSGNDDARNETATHSPRSTSETIQIVSKDLIDAVKTLLSSREEYVELLRNYAKSKELRAPYLFIYHSRKDLEEFQSSLPLRARTQLLLLSNYVTEQYAQEYESADFLLSQGKISPEYMQYLFKPGDLLLQRVNDQYMGFVATSWPKICRIEKIPHSRSTAFRDNTSVPFNRSQGFVTRIGTREITVYVCEINAWQWKFDGKFQRSNTTLKLEVPDVDESKKSQEHRSGKTIQIGDTEHRLHLKGNKLEGLNVFPIQYASAEIVEKCRRRGRIFWKCRNRSLVSYQDEKTESIQNLAGERYMIDLQTYHSLHQNNFAPLQDELGPDAMNSDDPPDDQFELLLPLSIKGFHLRRKKWFDLSADCIFDVKWNEEAFQSLVIDRKARDLITALVTNHIAAEKGTDLIMGKGNGLILLLHGGPGTGKTLTAEGVAEIAKKPLYRVTCGDVGTKAEEVEKYLESVLYLGKIWGCVVLLDEADIFLEQRSLNDMARNALVSVFLRVLEYYEGILVLTSNRVGTFDEAFKSRIQLALHYPNLGPYQRLRIWENFINRLESFGDDVKVDIAGLHDHLEDLKEEKMNGRQIRNAITTARQYAQWKGSTLTYELLKDVIEVSGRFDTYLDNLHGGFTQDQLAEDNLLRLA